MSRSIQLVGAIVTLGLSIEVTPAVAQPICYIVNSNGKMIDLTAMCGRTRSASASEDSTRLPRASNLKSLVYSGVEVTSFVSLSTFYALNSTRRAEIERVFSEGTGSQKAFVETICPSEAIRVTQTTTLNSTGQQIQSATGTSLGGISAREQSAVANFLCSNTEDSIQAMLQNTRDITPPSTPFTTLSSGNCDFPWQLDSKGRKCGNRAATRRSGGR